MVLQPVPGQNNHQHPCFALNKISQICGCDWTWVPLGQSWMEISELIPLCWRHPERFHEEARKFKEGGWHKISTVLINTVPEDLRLLENYLQMFNKIFFFERLSTNRCQIQIIDKTHPGYSHNAWGKTSTTDCEPALSTIFLMHNAFGLRSTPTERLTNYLATILHEGIHAFIDLHTCPCPLCNEWKTFRSGWMRGGGRTDGTGHTRLWCHFARSIELFSQIHLDLDITLLRFQDIAMEVASECKQTKSNPGFILAQIESEVMDFGLDLDEIWQDVQNRMGFHQNNMVTWTVERESWRLKVTRLKAAEIQARRQSNRAMVV